MAPPCEAGSVQLLPTKVELVRMHGGEPPLIAPPEFPAELFTKVQPMHVRGLSPLLPVTTMAPPLEPAAVLPEKVQRWAVTVDIEASIAPPPKKLLPLISALPERMQSFR